MKKIVFYIRDFFCGLCMAIAACGMFSCSDFLDEESHHALPDTQNWKTMEDAKIVNTANLLTAAGNGAAHGITHWKTRTN